MLWDLSGPPSLSVYFSNNKTRKNIKFKSMYFLLTCVVEFISEVGSCIEIQLRLTRYQCVTDRETSVIQGDRHFEMVII